MTSGGGSTAYIFGTGCSNVIAFATIFDIPLILEDPTETWNLLFLIWATKSLSQYHKHFNWCGTAPIHNPLDTENLAYLSFINMFFHLQSTFPSHSVSYFKLSVTLLCFDHSAFHLFHFPFTLNIINVDPSKLVVRNSVTKGHWACSSIWYPSCWWIVGDRKPHEWNHVDVCKQMPSWHSWCPASPSSNLLLHCLLLRHHYIQKVIPFVYSVGKSSFKWMCLFS